MAIVKQLQRRFPALVFASDVTLSQQQVRLYFSGYDAETDHFRPYAGLQAARRTWNKAPEPTVIFGFENKMFLQLSDDVAILEQKGVAWLAYTATENEMEQTIAALLRTVPAAPDQRIDQLGKADFHKELHCFGHVFQPNIITALRIRYNDLICDAPETSRTQYLAFGRGSADYLASKKLQFQQLLDQYRGMPFVAQCRKELDTIGQILEASDARWLALLKLAQLPFSNAQAAELAAGLLALIKDLEQMYALIKLLCNQLEPQVK